MRGIDATGPFSRWKRSGNAEIFRTMSGDQVDRIQCMNAADATTRFGTGRVGGALLVKTR